MSQRWEGYFLLVIYLFTKGVCNSNVLTWYLLMMKLERACFYMSRGPLC